MSETQMCITVQLSIHLQINTTSEIHLLAYNTIMSCLAVHNAVLAGLTHCWCSFWLMIRGAKYRSAFR